MKKNLLSLVVLPLAFSTTAFAQFQTAPAFPGAEGHGRFVTGGRGGEIRHVTNLNDSGSGSFREAVKGNNKKIVVFDVGGVIALNSNVTIGANTTILGQTAPSPGVTLRYYTVCPGENNIVRFIRIRRGQERDVNDGADASTQKNKKGILLDHCSLSWSIDEVASFYDNNNFTMQWCTIAESLANAGHGKGAHGYGGIWGGKLASFHHNMIAHVSNRGPRFNGARYDWQGYTSNDCYGDYKWANPTQSEIVDFRNCVMYNAQGTCYGGPGGGKINIVNNFYKAGPCGNGNQECLTKVSVSDKGNSDSQHPEYYGMTCRYYISGNTTLTTDGVKTANKDWAGVAYDGGVYNDGTYAYSKDANNMYEADVPSITYNNTRYVRIKMDEPAPVGYVTTHTADKAFEKVLACVGASYVRDEVDARYVEEAKKGIAKYTGSITKKPGLIDLVSDVNGYTEANFGTGSREVGYDTDNDGMPDEWEKKWGLDPNDASDVNRYTLDAKGYYTNIEMYANSLVENIMKEGCADGEANYTEYWPELKALDPGTPPVEEKVELYIAASTNVGGNTTSTYYFNTAGYDVTVTNSAAKGYQAAKEDGVKYSAKTYVVNLPENLVVTEATFKGYDNYAEADSYIKEVNGMSFAETDYVFPKKDGVNYVLTTHTVPVDNAVNTMSFSVGGKQVVWAITLACTKVTAINSVTPVNSSRDNSIYNLAGQKVSANYKGLVIKNGRKYLKVN